MWYIIITLNVELNAAIFAHLCEQTVYEMFIFLRIVLDRTVYIKDFILLSNAWGIGHLYCDW